MNPDIKKVSDTEYSKNVSVTQSLAETKDKRELYLKEIDSWQQKLDEIDAEIAAAEAVGVKDILPADAVADTPVDVIKP